MTYELAKQLKEAGFKKEHRMDRESDDPHCFDCEWYEDRGYESCCSPTLSELIEACGEGFQNLNRFDNEWRTNFMEDENMYGDSVGFSPEEAVANLWLALNKK